MVLLGSFIGLAISVKWVGIFTLTLIVIFTVKELWDMICNPAVPIRAVFRHTLARFVCLLVLPLVIYISMFYLHFKMIRNVELDISSSRMSPSFLSTLSGKTVIPDTYKRKCLKF